MVTELDAASRMQGDADAGSQSGSLLRGLEILKTLNQAPPRTLADLHRATGLPKPSLVRLLDTLVAAGYVDRLDGGRGFAPAPRLQLLTSGIDRHHHVVQVAVPLMNALCNSIAWPSDLAVRQGNMMVIRASTRATGPVRLAEPIVRSGLHLLRSELGLAYLAWCSPLERAASLAAVRIGGAEAGSLKLNHVLEQTRRRGYALRTDGSEVRELNALAVPIIVEGEVLASISVVFHERAVPLDHVVLQCLPRLRWCAEAIASALPGRPAIATIDP